MSNTIITTVNSSTVPKGEMGQKYLAAGANVAMRLWQNEQPAEPKPKAARDYETVGYVIIGMAELHIEDRVLELAPGDSWVVPKGVPHTYKIKEAFTAVEATTPPARVGNKDS
ncbi:MAG: cupin domain-containing protein [Cyanobacteria bacterium J06600_6]